MKYSLANPPLEKVEQCIQDVEAAFVDFDAKVKQAILVHDYSFEKVGYESKALFWSLTGFLIGLIVAMIWFYSLGIEARANVAIWGEIGLFFIFCGLIVGVWGVIRSVKGFSAYLRRRDIQRKMKKGSRLVKNIENYFKTTPLMINGDKSTKNAEFLKTLKGISDGFKEIHDLFSYYPRAPTISILSLCSLLATIIAIQPVYQWMNTITNLQEILTYLPPIMAVIFLAFFGSFAYYLVCCSRNNNINALFGINKSEQKLVNSLEQMNTTLIGDDFKNLFSETLLVIKNEERLP